MSMSMHHHRGRQAARGQSRADRVEYQLLVAVVFLICFVMAGATRLVGVLRGKPIDSHGRSVFAEARASAHATAGYAFLA